MRRTYLAPAWSLRGWGTMLVAAWVNLVLTGAAAWGGPTAVIKTLGVSGQAPLTVHVHGLDSGLSSGDPATARYEWNFGDAGVAYNALVGWNAAHTYDHPGTHVITLKLTDQYGATSVKRVRVTVAANARRNVYVSPDGADSNDGATPSRAVRTARRAFQLAGDNTYIRFRRDATYLVSSTLSLNDSNMVVGAYGSGAKPRLRWTVDNEYSNIIAVSQQSERVTIQDLAFDSPFQPNNHIVRAIGCAGRNLTVRRCHFGKVSDALNASGDVFGWLTQANTAGVLGGYYAWAEGEDHVHLGNSVADSEDEHTIRLGGARRVNISHNRLRNTRKSTIWCMLGQYCCIRDNVIRDGRVLTGPNHANSNPHERFKWLVFECNQVVQEGVICYGGSEHIVLRNNVFRYDGGECISLWGLHQQYGFTCRDIRIHNNTGRNYSDHYGKFLRIGGGSEGVSVVNNLYCAPKLNSPWGASNVVAVDVNLTQHRYLRNYWSVPAFGENPHSVSGHGKTMPQWNHYGETIGEHHRRFSISDLTIAHSPLFNANLGQPVKGVFDDFHGRRRPASGPWTIGAVQSSTLLAAAQAPAPQDPQEAGGINADVNVDQIVDGLDVLAALSSMGACEGCGADVNDDGLVDAMDIAAVANARPPVD